MCGIGAVYTKEPLGSIKEVVTNMALQQNHRGPDFQGVYTTPDSCVGLSHARLSIVDLSSQANQPMSNEDGRLWLVCNGEIYNFRELRKEMKVKGHHFNSNSDSEVILHLYEEYGIELTNKLHGMFAFALYDDREHLLFCARDRLGKKPLVYADTPAGVAIASEIPALRFFPNVDFTIDPVAFGLYLLRNLRHIPDPWTFYRGVHKLKPGHAMVIQDGEIQRIWKYWHPSYDVQPASPQQLLEIFDRAVALRMVADVEVGALLSGGVDSSGIVQAMIAQGVKDVRTYAMGLNADDEELRRARKMAEFLGTRHKEFYFEADKQHEQIKNLLEIYGEPVIHLPLALTYELCEQISKDGIKVVMAGHGADEIFYGYSGHNSLALLTMLLPFVPKWLQPILSKNATRFSAGGRFREALLLAGSPIGQRKAALYKDEARRLWGKLFDFDGIDEAIEDSIGHWLATWFKDDVPKAYIDEANIIGLMHEDNHSVTIAGDLPAMAAGIEVRCPFLDQDMVEYAWHTQFRQKIKSVTDMSQNKWILKKALEARLPNDLLYAPKRGFGYYISEEDVLRGPWKTQVDEVLADPSSFGGLLQIEEIRNLKRSFDRKEGVPAMLIAKLYAAFIVQNNNHNRGLT